MRRLLILSAMMSLLFIPAGAVADIISPVMPGAIILALTCHGGGDYQPTSHRELAEGTAGSNDSHRPSGMSLSKTPGIAR